MIAPKMASPAEQHTSAVRMRMAALSLVIGICLLAAKLFAYYLTGSSAVLSDALESIVNIAAAGFALYSVYQATKPPDRCHPYGHGKIEFFSAGFEGALIILAALGIFWVGWKHLAHPRPIPRLDIGLIIVCGSSVINLWLGIALIRVGRRTRSLALEADGRHIMTDVVSSAGVVAGLGLVLATRWYWLDGAIAFLVGINILFSGGKLIRESFRGLMDASDPGLIAVITTLIIQRRRPAWIDIHRLRAWRSGPEIHIDLHLILPKDMPLETAHREAQHLESLLFDHIEGCAGVLVHMDPCRGEDCPLCGRQECSCRREDPSGDNEWAPESMTMGRSFHRNRYGGVETKGKRGGG
jgi:cation diffusion facilitator family transporter